VLLHEIKLKCYDIWVLLHRRSGKASQHLLGATMCAFSFFYIFWNSDYRQRFPLKSTEIWRSRKHWFCVLKFPRNPLHSTRGALKWCRVMGCLIFMGHFPQKCPMISGSFAEMTCNLRHPVSLRNPVALKCHGTSEWHRSATVNPKSIKGPIRTIHLYHIFLENNAFESFVPQIFWFLSTSRIKQLQNFFLETTWVLG